MFEPLHMIRGQNVILDYEAAQYYGVSIRLFRWMATRHQNRFPSDCMLKLSRAEGRLFEKCQLTPNYAFTDTGLLLLSSILNTPKAVSLSIEIVRELFGFRYN